MSWFRSLFGRKPSTSVPTRVRERLFGDVSDCCPEGAEDSFPWSAFDAANTELAQGRTAAAIGHWREILAHRKLKSCHYLLACRLLRQHGQHPPAKAAKQVLGVVVEVGLPMGIDTLAAYADRSVSLSGSSTIECLSVDETVEPFVAQFLAAGAGAATSISPWDQTIPPAPEAGQIQFSVLTPHGLHFAQGSLDVFPLDPMAGPVLQAALALRQAIGHWVHSFSASPGDVG